MVRFFVRAFGSVLGALLILPALATEPVHFGMFGNVHTAVPSGDPLRAVVFVSDSSGWDARSESLAQALSADGAIVFGIDLPAYLAQMESINDKCSLPASHFEEMTHWMQRNRNLKSYLYPLLVGDGAGATFAYGVDAQAPRGTYSGLVTLGWDGSLRLTKPLCSGDAGAMTSVDAAGAYRIAPVKRLPNSWLPQPFAPGARSSTSLQALPRGLKQGLTISPGAPAEAQAAAAVAQVFRSIESAAVLPQDVADLPLVEVPAQGTPANRIAVILTGDGGWAGLDVAVANQLAKRGIDVVGLNTLKFFWQTRKPEEAADALTRIIGHYGSVHAQSDFVVIGYSFGAALAPVVVNRVPDTARQRIAAQVLISPDPEAVFEIHVGDWFGSTHHEGAIQIAPEIARTQVPVICVHGEDEGADSFCQTLAGKPNVRDLGLPGGHHYNGDYDKLGAGIAGALPAARK